MENILKDSQNNNYMKDNIPFDKFDKIDNDIVAFYMKYNQLKNLYRQGWLKMRMGLDYIKKCESVADHSFAMALLGLTMIEKYNLPYDGFKVLKMCIIHELGEIYVGDYTPFDNISKEEKYLKEKQAIKVILNDLDFDTDFLELWEEFEKCETKEAIFVKNLDQMEFLMQAAAYGTDISFYKRSLSKITDSNCLEMVEELLKISKGNTPPMKEG